MKEKIQNDIYKAVASGKVWTGEHLNKRKDGSTFFCELRISPLIDDEGQISGYIGIQRDITKRKQAEEALQESEARFRDIASSIPGVIYQFLLKKDGSYSSPYVSESASSILDISAKEVIANPYSLFDRILKEDVDSVNKSIIESARTMKTWFQEFRIKTKAGDVKWIRGVSIPHLLPDGEILWNGVLLDITGSKQAEDALRKSHEELEIRVKERTESLEIKTNNLEEVNTALKVLLEKRDEDKINIEEKVLANVKQLVVPYLEKLKTSGLNERQMAYAGVLESNLDNIISPFSNRLSSKLLALSPTEIRIANLVKQGRNTKEIAEMMGVSMRTIDTHRRNIRKKLGLKSKKSNLRTHLLSIQ